MAEATTEYDTTAGATIDELEVPLDQKFNPKDSDTVDLKGSIKEEIEDYEGEEEDEIPNVVRNSGWRWVMLILASMLAFGMQIASCVPGALYVYF